MTKKLKKLKELQAKMDTQNEIIEKLEYRIKLIEKEKELATQS